MTWRERRNRKRADRMLAQGQTARAVRLLESAGAWNALVDVYQSRGDLKRAAQAAERAAEYGRAAKLYEGAGAHREAAEQWMKASQRRQAAQALEQAGDREAAAALYADIGLPVRAADLLAGLGREVEAAKLYEEAGATAKAVKMYTAAGQMAEGARTLEEAGQYASAARLHREVGDRSEAARLFALAQDHFESAQSLSDLGRHEEAGRTFEESGHLLHAAEVYEKSDTTIGRAAELFGRMLRPKLEWRRELKSSVTCLCVARDSNAIAVGCSARRAQLFAAGGEVIWTFKPVWGGVPNCIAVSSSGHVAVGCDDGRLYFLDDQKNVLWSYRPPSVPTKVSVSDAGDKILCAVEGNVALCLNGEGTPIWNHRAVSHVWDVDLSGDGNVATIGTADGTCEFLTGEGERLGQYGAPAWVHSVSLNANGSACALGAGMDTVELVNARRFETVWSTQDTSPVHNVLLTPQGAVLSVGDREAVLRTGDGTIMCRYPAEDRLMGGDIGDSGQFMALRCVDRKVVKIALLHCRERAAAGYEKAGDAVGAAEMYEAMGEHERAAEMFSTAGKNLEAARNMAQAGRALEAAELFESIGEFAKAGPIFQEQGQFDRAAACFARAEDLQRAGEMFEQSGDLPRAARIFEQAGLHGKAGDVYRAAGDVTAAIRALRQHLAENQADTEKHLELGVLMQENGQYDTAIEEFQSSVSNDRLRKQALIHVAECFVAKNLYDIAINRYRACLEEGEDVGAGNLDVFYGIGRAYELAGNYAEARRLYERIMAVDYNYAQVSERLAEVESLEKVFFQGSATVAADPMATEVAPSNYQMLSSDTKEKYAVKRLLGKGGMGEVYLAEDKRLKRTVALKILPQHVAQDDQLRLRMVREAQAVAQISHRNVVAVYDVGEEAGRSYISMEYVDGQDLGTMLKEKGRFPPKECMRLLLQITDGLACAHEKGIVHRDMKPANVLVASADGTAKLMDFGLAVVQGATRLTMPGGISGTWMYMSPEQIRGSQELTPAADIYAVGCMAYELLTGHTPFTGDDVGTQHLLMPPTPLTGILPDLPPAVNDVVMKCLGKEPPDRYPDALALHRALQDAAADL